MTETLTLEQDTWRLGAPLAGADPAGFGRIFEVSDGRGRQAVAKLVRKQPGADRELLFSDLPTGAKNVIPILDAGEHEDSLVLVMPRAEMSLEHRLQGTTVDLDGAVRILSDVAEALDSLDGAIVHRDLKPANVLLWDGRWCLADFGIARYADASTAPDTRKFSMSPPYAAPEQWTYQSATAKTDMYAFGVMAFQLVTGELPFTGSTEDLRAAHLNLVPKSVGPVRLRSIIEECLYKAPEARPSAANVLARLRQVAVEPKLPGASALARVSESVRGKRALAFAEQRASEDETSRRARLLEVAMQSHGSLLGPLFTDVEAGVGNAGQVQRRPRAEVAFVAEIAGAKLSVTAPIGSRTWSGPFDVIATAAVTVHRNRRSRGGWLGRSHSLWYCDAHKAGDFSWFELAFMAGAFGGQPEIVPYSSSPESAGVAFAQVIGTEQLAWPVSSLDRDEPTEFVDRWIGWFAGAADGTLEMPSTLPERNPSGSWRR